METVIVVVIVFFLLNFIGKLKGAPAPETMTESAIFQRLQTEEAWISKYLSQPYSTQQRESLKRMYDKKTVYIQSLKAELMKRQMAQGLNAIQHEMAPILQRISELVKQGVPEAEAHGTALKEWHSKNT